MSSGNAGRKRRIVAAIGSCILAAGLLVGGQAATAPAQALDLPTWEDVQAAKNNEAAASKKITEIENLIAEGEKELDRLRNLHSTTIADLQAAEVELARATEKVQTLERQAEESKQEAEDAADRAGVIVAQMYRSGGVDRSMELFLDSNESTADALLERMASMSKATERNTQISEEAEQAANTAASLSQQAESARQEREVLRQDYEAKEAAAAEAVTTQGEKVQAQETQQRDLEAKLAALKDETATTVEGYQERLRIEEEQRRKAAEEAARRAEEARRAAEEAARQAASGGGGGGGGGTGGTGGGGGGGGVVAPPPPSTSNGWTIPTSGYYVSEGFRSPGRWDHTGIDLATGCGTPIVAAGPGQVAMAYWDNGGGGNMVSINHPNGWQTRYAHMISWAIVGGGQWVEAGQIVGFVGSTGASTGCHLHFEMRPNQDTGWYDFVNPAYYINF